MDIPPLVAVLLVLDQTLFCRGMSERLVDGCLGGQTECVDCMKPRSTLEFSLGMLKQWRAVNVMSTARTPMYSRIYVIAMHSEYALTCRHVVMMDRLPRPISRHRRRASRETPREVAHPDCPLKLACCAFVRTRRNASRKKGHGTAAWSAERGTASGGSHN